MRSWFAQTNWKAPLFIPAKCWDLQSKTSNRVLINNGYIFVELSESPEQVVLSVKDNGIGISSEDQKNIFQRFYRADKSRASKGTGIGLAMVNEIAELHKGTISVNSILGEGSTFLFIISKSPH